MVILRKVYMLLPLASRDVYRYRYTDYWFLIEALLLVSQEVDGKLVGLVLIGDQHQPLVMDGGPVKHQVLGVEQISQISFAILKFELLRHCEPRGLFYI